MKRSIRNGRRFMMMVLACLVIMGGNPIFQIWDINRAYASTGEEWTLMGEAGFSAGEASAPKMALDQSGTPYVAYTDLGAGFKATVMKYTEPNGWQLVGDRGLSLGSASGITLVLDHAGTPYIGYQDNGAGGKATVMKYSESDGWELVGEAGFTPDRANYPSLALDQAGNPYIAFKDGASGKASVMMYSEPTGWALVGTADFSPEVGSAVSLVLDRADMPYLAFQDASYNTTVMRFRANSWELVGQEGISSGYATSPSLALSPSGNPYVAFVNNASKVTVMTYQDVKAAWEEVGQSGFSPGTASSPSLAVDQAGTPFVVFKDGANGNKATLMKYSEQYGWEFVGQAGFSAGVVSTPSLALDQAGKPCVAYQDASSVSKATVMTFGAKVSYTVTYDGNGAQAGNPPVDYQQYSEQAGVTVFDNTGILEKTGYTFAGWNTQANGSGTSYNAGETLVMGSSNLTLYAVWIPVLPDDTDNPDEDINKWKVIGNAGFSEGMAFDQDLAVDANGTPYVVYQDASKGYKATVMKFSGANGWTAVGQPGFTESFVTKNKLAIDQSGTVYVAFSDINYGGKATVMKYTEQDGWKFVGFPGFTSGNLSSLDMKLDTNGVPYVAVNSGYQLTVMKYNNESGEWMSIGNPGNTLGGVGGSILALGSDGVPYVAFSDNSGGFRLSVIRYNEADDSWSFVGNRAFSQESVAEIALAVDQNETVYVVYTGGYDGQKPTVMKYTGSGTWTEVGSARFSEGAANFLSMVLDQDGSPYVAYMDSANMNKASVMKYTEADGWNAIGGAGFSEGIAQNTALEIDAAGNLYISFKDGSNGNKATVMSYAQPKRYQITYNSNGASAGNVPLDNRTYKQQTLATILGNTGNLVKTGYTFAGWNTAADGSGENYSVGDTFLIGTSNVTLFAKWLVSNNGGTNPPDGSDNSSGGNGGNGSNPGSGSTSGGSASGTAGTAPSGGGQANVGVSILVNGKPETAGTLKTSKLNGQNVLTLIVDEQAVMQKLDAEGKNAVVTLPVNSGEKDRVIGELTGQLVKFMADKEAMLVLQTDAVSYSVPSRLVEINTLAQQLGAEDHFGDVLFHLEIAPASAETISAAETVARQNGYALIGPLFDFNITATYGDKTVSVDRFNEYVERAITLSNEVDPTQVTTGVVVEKDGGVRHVPTKITQVNGVYHAQINSLTNSAYGLVWNPQTFVDVVGHWAETEVNDMGSRMVVRGISDTIYNPDASITRSEFAAVIVRALGLQLGEENDRFSDVNPSDWYADVVSAASNLGLIDGYADGTFRPTQKITREEAMMIINRTMKLTSLDRKLHIDTDQDHSRYLDMEQVSYWAKEAVDFSLESGLVSGRSNATLAPKSMITRAETAVLIHRLLQHSGLI
ncbi:S-layer homology domain-containing protein [Paenibacillus sp. NPDC057886]|uniref:S-layer homology domain-containing protein n=1 Tax=Paenibacillus sp. NPDC057886 TaxID=3346270 RepID=UPI0036A69FDB